MQKVVCNIIVNRGLPEMCRQAVVIGVRKIIETQTLCMQFVHRILRGFVLRIVVDGP
jgi:hypothetical protein